MEEGYFDYHQVIEQEEKLDFDKLANCSHCKKLIPYDATMCFYCGKVAATHKKSVWMVWAAAILITIFIIAFILN
ncbi:MAG: hypothetical protein KJ711_02670 [Candidatus Omnitrophica bacterium]|nr:hypothetical protein [Candidatus Omnitrophota bacterium]MBU1524212.1 hypothetical protein [Candidatus Omnitrophota bacterium]